MCMFHGSFLFIYVFYYLLPLEHLDAFGSTQCDYHESRLCKNHLSQLSLLMYVFLHYELGVVLSCSGDVIHGRRIQINTVTICDSRLPQARYLHQFSSLCAELPDMLMDVDGHGRQGQRKRWPKRWQRKGWKRQRRQGQR